METFINVILLIIMFLSGNGYGNAAEVEVNAKANQVIAVTESANKTAELANLEKLEELEELEIALEEEIGHDFDSDEIDCEEDVVWLNCDSWESCEELFLDLM